MSGLDVPVSTEGSNHRLLEAGKTVGNVCGPHYTCQVRAVGLASQDAFLTVGLTAAAGLGELFYKLYFKESRELFL